MVENKENELKKADDRNIWDKLEDASKKVNEGFDATILEVEEMTNEEYFGKSGYEQRNGMKITVEVENGEKFDVWYSTPSIRGVEKSNAFAFKQKYGSYPKPDLDVTAIITEKGFWGILLD